MAKQKIATAKEVELNRWCIEMAMRWPVVTSYGNGDGNMVAGQLGYNYQRQDCDADVIGRANKIKAWIQAA